MEKIQVPFRYLKEKRVFSYPDLIFYLYQTNKKDMDPNQRGKYVQLSSATLVWQPVVGAQRGRRECRAMFREGAEGAARQLRDHEDPRISLREQWERGEKVVSM